MKFCMQCGHELGASRTCRSCGAIAPVEPPPAPQLTTSGPRYPLFADEVDSVGVSTSGRVLPTPVQEPLGSVSVAPSAPPAPSAEPAAWWADSHEMRLDRDEDVTQVRLPSVPVVPGRRRGMTLVWLLLVALVVGALVLGARLLLAGGSPDASPTRSGSPSASAAGSAAGTAGSAAGSADDVAATATAEAPVTRPPGVDTHGARTSYDAANMLDGDAATAWEMPGDGTGTELTFTLAGRTHLTSVGLVNGYAKTGTEHGRRLDWYAGNRRVLRVEWLFDDGTSVEQRLRRTRALQRLDVDTTTATVRLRLVEVSRPGKGRASRDMTPVSEVALTGTRG